MGLVINYFPQDTLRRKIWPLELAANIAVKALLTSTFEETLMCVMDDKTRLIYQAALDRYLSAKFLQKIFRGLLTTQYIYPTALRRHTFPLWSIWNLVFKLSSGTLPQNVGAWASRTSKRNPRPITITPWNSNGESPWNILDLITWQRTCLTLLQVKCWLSEAPNFVDHDARIVDRGTRITVRTSCSLVCCSCSRSSTASCSTASSSVY